jgi:hypothetical protein
MLTHDQVTPEQHQLAVALHAAGQVDRVVIDIIPGGFVWRLSKGGEEIYAGESTAEQVAPMLRATEIVLNTELGIREAKLCEPALN